MQPRKIDRATGLDGLFRNSWSKRLWVLLFATLLAFYFGSQSYWAARYNRDTSQSWAMILYWNLAIFYLWALLSPLVFWLCRKLRDAKLGWTRTVLLYLAFGVLLSLAHCLLTSMTNWLWRMAQGEKFSFAPNFAAVMVYRFQINVFLYCVLVGFWHAFDYHRRFQERRLKAAELEASLAQVQLLALKMQLQPHFLFNTLQAIAELMHADVEAAEEVTLRLSELLRLTLISGTEQEISLEDEIGFLQAYLAIEQVRLKERLTVELQVGPGTHRAKVPTLLLQPLVENAIRHGIAPFPRQGSVRFRSSRENGALILEISDTGPGLGREPSAGGIGLSNTRERLQRLYGLDHGFELIDNAGLTVRIRLPFAAVPVRQDIVHSV